MTACMMTFKKKQTYKIFKKMFYLGIKLQISYFGPISSRQGSYVHFSKFFHFLIKTKIIVTNAHNFNKACILSNF